VLLTSWEKSKNWLSVTGTIVDTVYCGCSSSNNNNNSSCTRTYSAVIQYIVDGITYTFNTTSCSSPGPKVGNDIKVLYDPSNPSTGVDGSFVALWLAPMILLPLGVCSCFFCCVALFKMMAGNKTDPDNGFGADTAGDNKIDTFQPAFAPPPPASAPFQPSYVTSTPQNAPDSYAQSSYTATGTTTFQDTTNPTSQFEDTFQDNTTKPTTSSSMFDQMRI